MHDSQDLIGDEWRDAMFPNYDHDIVQQVHPKKRFVCLRCKRVAKLKNMDWVPCHLHWERLSSGYYPEP